MIASTTSTSWSFEKGIYSPPTVSNFPSLRKRQIIISDSIHEKIGLLIGKDGCHFIELTNKYNLLYIFYHENKIELYGLDDKNIMGAIHELIRKIKYLNYLDRTARQ
jgi:ABC-type Na+ transport system ATPase subunit NatA